MQDLQKYAPQIQKCAHCQFCQAACPVFLEDLLETHTARARLELIRACFLENSLPPSSRFKEIIERCLLCTNCVQTCPAALPADEMVMAARYQLYQGKRRNALTRTALHRFMKQRGLGALLSRAGALAQGAGLLPPEFPAPSARPFLEQRKGVIPAEGKTRARVAYFVGCGTNTFYPETAEDTVRVLTRNGIEVLLPEGLVCCGIPALAEGDLAFAQECAAKNMGILTGLQVDAIITDCTSCGMSLKVKQPKLIPENDPLFMKAAVLAPKVWEATDYLNSLGLVEEPGRFPARLTYHIPCHRGWSSTLKNAPRALCSRVSGAELIEMEYPERCCGAGGLFFVNFRELAQSIRAKKVQDIQQTGAQMVLTHCPSCKSYLAAALPQLKVMHPLSLLARAYGF